LMFMGADIYNVLYIKQISVLSAAFQLHSVTATVA
jgi:hypothetical protein